MSSKPSSSESLKKASTPLPKVFSHHPAYQRALHALTDQASLSDEQIQKLPQEAHGISAERKKLIQSIKQSSDETQRLSFLLDLRYRFGLPHDLEILYYCLNLDQEHLTIDALTQLQQHLSKSVDVGLWRDKLKKRLLFLEVRSFNARVQSLTKACLHQL